MWKNCVINIIDWINLNVFFITPFLAILAKITGLLFFDIQNLHIRPWKIKMAMCVVPPTLKMEGSGFVSLLLLTIVDWYYNHKSIYRVFSQHPVLMLRRF